MMTTKGKNSDTWDWEDVAGGGGPHDILSAVHVDTVIAAKTRGAVWRVNSVPKWEILAHPGLAGRVLKSDALDTIYDVLNHSQLGSVGPDDHHAQLHKAAHVSGGDAFVKSDILNAVARYIELIADPGSDAGRFWLNVNRPKFWTNDGTPLLKAFALTDDAVAQFSGGISAAQHGSLSGISNAHPFSELQGTISDAQHGSRGTIANAHAWADINKTVSAIADITTRPHSALSGIGANDHHAQDHRARHISAGADAFLSTDLLEAIVKRLRESGGPTDLTLGSVPDGYFLQRSGATIIGSAGGGGGDNISVNGTAANDADFDDAVPAPPAGRKNVKWQKDALTPNNLSAYMDDVATVLFREATLITISASTTETDIFNQTIPANAMGTNRILRLTILAARLNNSGSSETAPTFRAYTGGTVRYADADAVLSANASWSPVLIELYFAMQNASNVMYLGGRVVTGTQGGATTGIGDLASTSATVKPDTIGPATGTTFTQDTTVDWALRITWQNGTSNASVTFRRHYAILELL